MIFNEADELAELLKGIFPVYLLIALPLFIIISPVCPVTASHEFPVYRMQQYDLHGVPHGCRSAPVNLEARSLSSWSTGRHCVVARMQDISADQFREIRAKAGALLVALPRDLSTLTDKQKQVSNPLVPRKVSLLHSVSANGYQIVINTNKASPRIDVNIASIQGKLSGYGVEDKLPTIAIVAHYDSFGIAPELAFGAESNGSGVVLLLELVRLFANLYASSSTFARANLLFLLSGGGKLNYQGSKKWLEDNLDAVDGSLLQDASFVICLDSIAQKGTLNVHVSKPPKEGSAAANFLKELETASENKAKVEMIHKKINLKEEVLAWEHERYSIRRLPAFTLSSIRSHKDPTRGTILDVKKNLNMDALLQNARIVAQALSSHIYNISTPMSAFSEDMGVEEESMRILLDFLASQPRAAQLLAEKNNPLVSSLHDIMSRYLKDVKVTYQVADKRDPEFVFYDVSKSTVNVYSVKPAVFDLFLTFAIAIYLGVVYLFVQNFPTLYSTMLYFASTTKKSKVN
ncbi:nicalin-like [Nilaparvata lugens]|uniref:nicalin-like n=1 Tax=Nilaparvata lugens TaxID=108931 RepID=UPI00193E10BF|nr:nicalin-like [Nilaparvata lugens]